jgi:D-serine deaminase-like pyridoxal phosphate-dependent protein
MTSTEGTATEEKWTPARFETEEGAIAYADSVLRAGGKVKQHGRVVFFIPASANTQPFWTDRPQVAVLADGRMSMRFDTFSGANTYASGLVRSGANVRQYGKFVIICPA